MKRLHCENSNNFNNPASGISSSVCVNHLWPVVAGGGGMKDEALKLALEALETELAVDMTNGAEVGEAAELMCEAMIGIKQALAAQPAVPDAIHHTDLSESLEYIQGWNDCRAEMLRMNNG
jgi:hypothetical protein